MELVRQEIRARSAVQCC